MVCRVAPGPESRVNRVIAAEEPDHKHFERALDAFSDADDVCMVSMFGLPLRKYLDFCLCLGLAGGLRLQTGGGSRMKTVKLSGRLPRKLLLLCVPHSDSAIGLKAVAAIQYR